MRLRLQIFWPLRYWSFQVGAWRHRGVINIGPFQILRRSRSR